MGAKKEFDFDSNAEARKNLLEIIDEESRLLFPHEVAWFLARSLSDVYASVPRVKSSRSPVRFDAAVVKAVKTGDQIPLVRSVTNETKEKSSGLPRSQKKGRKEKVPLCL